VQFFGVGQLPDGIGLVMELCDSDLKAMCVKIKSASHLKVSKILVSSYNNI